MSDPAACGDFELLERWEQGSLGAGNELFERYFDEVYRFFEHKTDQDAADLVQRTFLACLESRGRFQRNSSFRTYLYGIARNLLHGYWRQKKRASFDVGASTLRDLGQSPSNAIAERHERRLLLEALRSIPLDLQIALELYYWENLGAPELAEVLEIPEGTVRSRLRRAREALEKRLGELEASPERLASTLASLEGWALRVRGGLRASPEAPGQRRPLSSSSNVSAAPLASMASLASRQRR
jgi:RNA polymerase sigma factor (sigma-70 family)